MPNANECLSDELTCQKLNEGGEIKYVICTDGECRPCLKIADVLPPYPEGGTTGIRDVPIPIVKLLFKFTGGPIPLTALDPVIREISGKERIDNNDKRWVGAILKDRRLVVEVEPPRGQYRLTDAGRRMLDAAAENDEALFAALTCVLRDRAG